MAQSEYITVEEADKLLRTWEVGFSGQSWFREDKYGTEWQAYWLEDDKLVRFVPDAITTSRIPVFLTRQEFEELFE